MSDKPKPGHHAQTPEEHHAAAHPHDSAATPRGRMGQGPDAPRPEDRVQMNPDPDPTDQPPPLKAPQKEQMGTPPDSRPAFHQPGMNHPQEPAPTGPQAVGSQLHGMVIVHQKGSDGHNPRHAIRVEDVARVTEGSVPGEVVLHHATGYGSQTMDQALVLADDFDSLMQAIGKAKAQAH